VVDEAQERRLSAAVVTIKDDQIRLELPVGAIGPQRVVIEPEQALDQDTCDVGSSRGRHFVSTLSLT